MLSKDAGYQTLRRLCSCSRLTAPDVAVRLSELLKQEAEALMAVQSIRKLLLKELLMQVPVWKLPPMKELLSTLSRT